MLSLANKEIVLAANACTGSGGQGEYLRQMVNAYARFSHARIFSRFAGKIDGVSDLSFKGFPERFFYDLIINLPYLRGRHDWLTLLSDLEFDRRVSQLVGKPDLFEGVSGQCCDSFKRIRRSGSSTVLVCSSLNTHVDYLLGTLKEEHQKIGLQDPPFVHPRMRRRILEEIEIADRIRVVTHWAKQTFVEREVPEEKIDVLHPAVDRRRFYPVEKKDKTFRVMFVGMLSPRKGIHYLLQAFEKAHISDSELVLMGSTGDRWSRKIVQDYVRRNHNIRQENIEVAASPVAQTYGRASVMVHAAVEDGSGVAIAEALASGRPVIVTRQSGFSELIEDGKNGFVVERRSPEEISERLRLLAADQALLKRMTESAARDTPLLDYDQFAERIAGFYTQCLT